MSKRLLNQFIQDAFSPTSVDLARAVRSTIGFMAPLVLVHWLPQGWEASYISLVAQNVAMVDVRGAYPLRVAVLVVMTLILAVSGAAGAFAAGSLVAGLLVTALFSLATGIWRHLSSDYGVSLSIISLLVLFLALAGTPGPEAAKHHLISMLIGGGFGLLLQLAFWPIRPEHPLRRAASESWLAVADLLEALGGTDDPSAKMDHDKVNAAEHELRGSIDRVALLLIQAGSGSRTPLLSHLENLNLCAARLSVRVMALHTALEGTFRADGLQALQPALNPLFNNLKNIARSVAITVVSRNPSHLAGVRVRSRRSLSLLRVVRNQLHRSADTPAHAQQLETILSAIEEQLPSLAQALAATTDRAGERAAFPVELFDLNTWMLRPLASTLNFQFGVEPALQRYVFRLSVLTVSGVLAFKLLHLPHGYWLPFTMVVVLQPDYGATRQRAAQRVAGTVSGSVLASGLLWLALPPDVALVVIAISVFCFAYVVRRSYGLAIFFVTIFVVLLMESGGPRDLRPVVERVLSTLSGGMMAFVAALLFWPLWEKRRFPGLLAAALRANATYIERLSRTLAGTGNDDELVLGKRSAEQANSQAFSSLRRMLGDPQNQRERIEQAAALVNSLQRLTRVMNLIFVRFPDSTRTAPGAPVFFQHCPTLLRELATWVESAASAPERLRPLLTEAEQLRATPRSESGPSDRHWLAAQADRGATELATLLTAAETEWSVNATPAAEVSAPPTTVVGPKAF